MTLVIFGVGVLIFFISVYGAVIAGGLLLTANQLDDQPDLAAQAGLGDAPPDQHIGLRDITSTEF